MENFDKYLNEKTGDESNVNENVNNREQTISNYIEYNWYVDKKLSLLENLGGENERT